MTDKAQTLKDYFSTMSMNPARQMELEFLFRVETLYHYMLRAPHDDAHALLDRLRRGEAKSCKTASQIS